tara:strand:- start:45 stop:560 length:516 start_codon:yes stop_codon:yes gene_type:complete
MSNYREDHDQMARMDQLMKKDKCKKSREKRSSKILVKKLEESAKTPRKANSSDAGFDLYASQAATIPPGDRHKISTGISIAIPLGFVGLIWPRSGSAMKFGIDTLAGVIDSEYRGEICVILQNHGSLPYAVSPGDRIAQMIISKIPDFKMELSDSLDNTNRGTGGFGSTGV